VHADALNLQQLLMNLAINARDAMPDGGRLLIRTAQIKLDEQRAKDYSNLRPGDFLQLVVSDTGCGMPGAVLEHAFEPFFTTKEVGHGTGLGLATVYGIVTQHHGAIRIESQPGAGTTVEVLLPIVGTSTSCVRPASSGPGPRGCETILVAEDEPMVRELVVRNLESAGYRVIAVQDGEEAVETYLAGYEAIGLVLLDVVLPRMCGPEVYQRMREANPAVKAIFATAYDSETAGLGGLAQSGMRFIQKPAAGPELLEAVREVLDATAQIAAHI